MVVYLCVCVLNRKVDGGVYVCVTIMEGHWFSGGNSTLEPINLLNLNQVVIFKFTKVFSVIEITDISIQWLVIV